MLEVTFVALSSEEARAMETYADVPDAQLIEQFRLATDSALTELALLFGCSPGTCFVTVKSLREPNMTLLKAGAMFESGLLRLEDASCAWFAQKWAQTSWPDETNVFDLVGLLLSLRAAVSEHVVKPRELFACLEKLPS